MEMEASQPFLEIFTLVIPTVQVGGATQNSLEVRSKYQTRFYGAGIRNCYRLTPLFPSSTPSLNQYASVPWKARKFRLRARRLPISRQGLKLPGSQSTTRPSKRRCTQTLCRLPSLCRPKQRSRWAAAPGTRSISKRTLGIDGVNSLLA